MLKQEVKAVLLGGVSALALMMAIGAAHAASTVTDADTAGTTGDAGTAGTTGNVGTPGGAGATGTTGAAYSTTGTYSAADVVGGAGGDGGVYSDATTRGQAGNGGSGASGISISAGATVTISGTNAGGAGGNGGGNGIASNDPNTDNTGDAGDGGTAVEVSATGANVTISGTATGGAGGALSSVSTNDNNYTAGNGGAGVVLSGASTLTVTGTVAGGSGYVGGYGINASNGSAATVNITGATIAVGTSTGVGTTYAISSRNDTVAITANAAEGAVQITGDVTNSSGAYTFAASGADIAVTGNVTSGQAGITNEGNADVTFSSTGATSETSISGNLNITDYDATNDVGVVTLGTTRTNVSGSVTLAGTGTSHRQLLASTISATSAASGAIIQDGDSAISVSNVHVAPTVSGVGLATGEKIVLISNGSTANLTNVSARTATGLVAADTTYNTLVRQWSVLAISSANGDTDKWGNAIANNSVVLQATINSANTVAGVSRNLSGAFDTAANYTNNGTNTRMVGLNQAVQNLNNRPDVIKAANQLRPEANRASFEGVNATTIAALNTVLARTEQLRLTQNGGTGLNSGEAMRALGVWGQGFGAYGDQQSRQGVDGYTATTAGAAAGIDFRVFDPLRVGVAFSYGSTEIDFDGLNDANSTDVDSYQGTLYATYTGSPWYLNGMLAYALHDYDTTREVSFTGYSDTATGSHKGRQYSAKVEGGYPIPSGRLLITPTASLAYTRLNQDAYTETSAAGAALQVDKVSVDSVKSSLGTRLSTTLVGETAKWTPEIRAAWVHEYKDSAMNVTAQYAQGNGTAFTTTTTTPAADAAVLGLGLTVATVGNLSVTANYDVELKEDYVGHNGLLQLRADF